MACGFFRGGLAEAEREAAARRQTERQADLHVGDPEARNDMAMQTARQAEADARLFAGQLLAARRSGNQEIYERTERTVAPMLARQVAVAIAGRKRIPFDRAMGEAAPMVQAIVDGIRGMPAPARLVDNDEAYRRAEAAMAPTPTRSIAAAMAARAGTRFERAADEAEQATRALSGSLQGLPNAAIAIPPTERAPGDESGRVEPAEPTAPAQKSDQSDEEARPRQPSKHPDESLEDALRRLGDPDYMYRELEKLRDRTPEREESRRRWAEEYKKERGPAAEPGFFENYIVPLLQRLYAPLQRFKREPDGPPLGDGGIKG